MINHDKAVQRLPAFESHWLWIISLFSLSSPFHLPRLFSSSSRWFTNNLFLFQPEKMYINTIFLGSHWQLIFISKSLHSQEFLPVFKYIHRGLEKDVVFSWGDCYVSWVCGGETSVLRNAFLTHRETCNMLWKRWLLKLEKDPHQGVKPCKQDGNDIKPAL